MNIKLALSIIIASVSLIGSVVGGWVWLDDRINDKITVIRSEMATKREATEMYLDIRITMDEKSLQELDVIVDSGKTLTSTQTRRYEQLNASVERMVEKRREIMGL